MADELEISPSLGTKDGTPYTENSAAPIVYFDGVSCHGASQGVVEIELVIRTMAPTTDGGVLTKFMAAGRLRCGMFGAKSLRQSLDLAITAAEHAPQGEEPEPSPAASRLN